MTTRRFSVHHFAVAVHACNCIRARPYISGCRLILPRNDKFPKFSDTAKDCLSWLWQWGITNHWHEICDVGSFFRKSVGRPHDGPMVYFGFDRCIQCVFYCGKHTKFSNIKCKTPKDSSFSLQRQRKQYIGVGPSVPVFIDVIGTFFGVSTVNNNKSTNQ